MPHQGINVPGWRRRAPRAELRRNDHVVAAAKPDELFLFLETLRSVEECAVAKPKALLRLLAGEDDFATCKQFRKVRGEIAAHNVSCIYFRNMSGFVNIKLQFIDSLFPPSVRIYRHESRCERAFAAPSSWLYSVYSIGCSSTLTSKEHLASSRLFGSLSPLRSHAMEDATKQRSGSGWES